MSNETFYLLPLNDDGSPDVPGGFIYLPPPDHPKYSLRFLIEGSSSICRDGTLWINIPEIGKSFDRQSFRPFKLYPDFSRNIQIDVPVTCPGSFAYYVTFSPLPEFTITSSTPVKPARTPTHYIDGIPLNALSIFSVNSKFMGKYPEDWNRYLSSISRRKYNMVHFTPLMKRGASNSPYSIFDQLQFDDIAFPNGEDDVQKLIKDMEEKHSLLSLADVEHPEAGYSLDTALLKFSHELQTRGLPTEFKTVDELTLVMNEVKNHVIEDLCLWEFYVLDVKSNARKVIDEWKVSTDGTYKTWSLEDQASLIRQKGVPTAGQILGRYSREIDTQLGVAIATALFGNFDSTSSDLTAVENTLRKLLDVVNVPFYEDQLFNRIKYLRIDDHGPKLESYFTRLPLNKVTKKHNPKALALANNGWIWNADAMRDNAGPNSRAYLRREVIVWGDCVKLRYGDGPVDSPFLWDFMARYTRLMAKYFSGFRIDNCHSTPLVVAEYLIDEARKVRPDLAIFAELFTGSEEADYIFVKRLGINALIREAMQAWSAGELSRLVHRHGGRPIGSFELDLASPGLDFSKSQASGSERELIRSIRPIPVPALFMDCTHDNEMPAQKRTATDTLPNAALVAMCDSAIGSVMGYDEIYPKIVDLVHETRLYSFFDLPESPTLDELVNLKGISGLKRLLNELHTMMGQMGYDETFIHHDGEYITVHRVHPQTRKGIFLIAHTAFPGQNSGALLAPIHLAATRAKPIGSWLLKVQELSDDKERALSNKVYLQGLPSEVLKIEGARIEETDRETIISVLDPFVPGSIALFETSIPSLEHADELSNDAITDGAVEAFSELNLIDLNFVLYRCDAEERDSSGGQDGVYDIPNHGPLVYAGLQGWWSILEGIIRFNELGHPLCDHLRQGQWALDYIVNRLMKATKNPQYAALRRPAKWLEAKFQTVRGLPSFLLPRYFAIILLGDDVRVGQAFIQQLAMVSVQQTGFVNSASLWPKKSVPSLAAGLPHFATDWARCLLLCTGRFIDAKEHILAFASSGKLPRYNSRDSIWFLLQAIQDYTKMAPDGLELLQDKTPRRFLPYDDTWLSFDDPKAYSQTSTIVDIIQEVFQRHAQGISFREYNAGPELDVQMKSEGFNVDIRVDWETGLIFGGSQHNCGTWQDKMGESEKAGNKGVPGTPRDGAAIEITGLLYSALKWITDLNKQGLYPYDTVDIGNGKSITFKDWATKVKTNFERCYYIPLDPKDDDQYDVDSKIVNRRGIYKDLYRSGKPYEDYQLRSNFPIAMVVSPELFDPSKALGALAIADSLLAGPLGMATLDPSDLNYRPDYNNAEDSTDFATSKGRNYHQGPEWVWLRGYFLRALLYFDLARRKTADERTEAFQQVTRRLAGCKKALRESPWKGLTELTNRNGNHCADSHKLCINIVPCIAMSLTESAVAAMATALTVANHHGTNNGTDDDGPGRKWDDQLKGDLYTQLVISLALGITAFLSFCFLRPKWTELYAARRRQRRAALYLPELPDSFFGWIPVLWQITEEQVLQSAGLDAFVFLSFFRFAIRFTSTVFILAFVVLLPIHYSYTKKLGIPDWDKNIDVGEDGKKKFIDDPPYLWTYVVFTYIFTGLAIFMLFQETKKIIQTRQKYLGSQTSTTDRTIRLSGIPAEMGSEENIREFIEGLHIGEVESITLCRNWSSLDHLIEERLKVLRNLETSWVQYLGYKRVRKSGDTLPLRRQPIDSSFFSEDDERMRLLLENGQDDAFDRSRKRPMVRLWYGPLKLRYRKVDAIDYYEERLRRLDEEIQSARQKEYPPTELAFVTMKSIAAAQMLVQAILDPHPMKLLARLAPAPADVIWKNTYLPRARRMFQSWSITVLICFLSVFWSVLLVPVGTLLKWETLHKVLPQLADALARHPLVKSLVTTGLPTLAFSLLTVAVPYLYNWLSNHQGMMSRGDIELSVISKNFFFSFFNLFVIFTVIGTATNFYGLWEHLRDSFKDATTIATALANSLENLAPFYMNVFVLQGLGLFPLKLLEVGSVFLYPINYLMAKTPRDFAELSTPPTFSYGYSIPQSILILVICVIYGVFPASWLICFFGLVYFTIGNFIYKYQLLYAMDHRQHSTGRAWPMICNRVLVGLVVFQLAMAGTLGLRKAITLALLIVPLIGATVWFSYFYSQSYEPLTKFIALKSIYRDTPTSGDISPSTTSTFSPPLALDRDAFPIRLGGQVLGLKLKRYVNPSLILPLDSAWLPGRNPMPELQEDFEYYEDQNHVSV
ncbi:putative glycogen debranching enzyme Gdb1 [Aspergillus foveolatus]|uniref:putative glycogen debranching enzyme Gdb1 n=1 Tax=Aspergillus foveolatus TaxID=210207 RepID=UPI003CCD5298